MDQTSDQLIVELQSRLAFQEQTVQQLDEALSAQQQELLQLRRQVELLHERMKEQASALEQTGGSDLSRERPPHY
ncbi:MAG: SlyX family protein [Pseudomonadota bacterium]